MKSLSKNEFLEVLKKIEDLLLEAGFPKDSVELNFKNNENLKMDFLDSEVSSLIGIRTDRIKCGPCGGGGMIGVCCEF